MYAISRVVVHSTLNRMSIFLVNDDVRRENKLTPTCVKCHPCTVVDLIIFLYTYIYIGYI